MSQHASLDGKVIEGALKKVLVYAWCGTDWCIMPVLDHQVADLKLGLARNATYMVSERT